MPKSLQLSEPVKDVLSRATLSDHKLALFLPPGTLDRDTYQAVDKVLKKLGGKWSRSQKCHQFEADPSAQLQELLSGGKIVDQQKAYGFFPTPPEIADQVAVLADLEPHQTVLAPGGGRGSLIKAALARVPSLQFTTIEIDATHLPHLAVIPNTLVVHADFLQLGPGVGFEKNHPAFDRVIMNPPFNQGADVVHIAHAWRFLTPGGILVAILSPSFRFRSGKTFELFRSLHESFGEHEADIPAGAFKASGTNIATVMIRWKKPADCFDSAHNYY